MSELYGTLQRLYVREDLAAEGVILLDSKACHYFKNVLRRQEGESFRVFNGRDGEFIARIETLGKKEGRACIVLKLKDQPATVLPLHLLFSPLKKDRMDFLIEKAVELGVTDLHPVLMRRTSNRKINEDRLHAQIIEAAEQCERLTMPTLHPLSSLERVITSWSGLPLCWARERGNAQELGTLTEIPQAFLLGPEGGFDEAECAFLESKTAVKAVSLGERIYRAETAALVCLAYRSLLPS
ncbi:MAG: 16S rRNA (uracil(1498)-N(3))-methyltransferase [Alphaproteobacteria bacterium]|nr:16S rRNA (uracil(1498)-N(3))-methyltransferase [Alphaproteobacteria bacterium]